MSFERGLLLKFMDLIATVIVTGSPIRVSTIGAGLEQGEQLFTSYIGKATSELQTVAKGVRGLRGLSKKGRGDSDDSSKPR